MFYNYYIKTELRVRNSEQIKVNTNLILTLNYTEKDFKLIKFQN